MKRSTSVQRPDSPASVFSGGSVGFDQDEQWEVTFEESKRPRTPLSSDSSDDEGYRDTTLVSFADKPKSSVDLDFGDFDRRMTIEGDDECCKIRTGVIKYEMYTDKDRAAAVSLGSKDIKKDLENKKLRESRRKAPEEHGATIYMTQAVYESKQGHFHMAAHLLSKALELQPNSKQCLVARSRCYFQLAEYDSALKDAESALDLDREYVQAIYQKAETLYIMGDFEHSLVFFQRGFKMRPDFENFRLGVQKAQKAIENSIGQQAPIKLSEKDCEALQEKVVDEEEEALETPSPNQQKQKVPTSATVPKVKATKQLLGELAVDKVYLEQLLENKELTLSIHPSGHQAISHAREALSYLQTCQKFWLQEKPLYARKRTRTRLYSQIKGKRERSKEDMKGAKRSKDRSKSNVVMKLLEEADQAISDGQNQMCLQKCRQLLKLLQGCTDEELPSKSEIIANTYSNIGCAYLEMKDYKNALEYHQRDLQIAEKFHIDEAKSRALDNLGRTYALAGEYQNALDVWKQKIPICTHDLEKAWLYHELGRCLLELGDYASAKEYGILSLNFAEAANSRGWKLNGSVLIAQAEAYNHKFESSIQSFKKALHFAELNDDFKAKVAIEDTIKKLKQHLSKRKESLGENTPSDDSKNESGVGSSRSNPDSGMGSTQSQHSK